ncbi:MAG: hypothetical protein J3K34DRAFT_431622 [Monoraphidium minutum]|nr:MAG: hypothetical protein J3K34DRAFT_431622 [Monoraphidium minutum]
MRRRARVANCRALAFVRSGTFSLADRACEPTTRAEMYVRQPEMTCVGIGFGCWVIGNRKTAAVFVLMPARRPMSSPRGSHIQASEWMALRSGRGARWNRFRGTAVGLLGVTAAAARVARSSRSWYQQTTGGLEHAAAQPLAAGREAACRAGRCRRRHESWLHFIRGKRGAREEGGVRAWGETGLAGRAGAPSCA